jgi:hypothetical protein
MPNKELGSARLKLWTRNAAKTLTERSVCRGRVGVGGGARVVERGKDAWRTLLLDQVADDLVVEVVDRRPL